MIALIFIGLGLAALTIVCAAEDGTEDTSQADMTKHGYGDDLLIGTNGIDLLLDGNDDDLLMGQGADDVMAHMDDTDKFLFGSHDILTVGTDRMTAVSCIKPARPAVITDFEPGQDVLIYTHDGPAPIIAVDEDTNGDAVLIADGLVTVTFANLAAVYLSESDLILQQRLA